MSGRFSIAAPASGDGCATAVASIPADPPEWFGVQENARRYAETARHEPTWLALAGDRSTGVMTLTRPTDAARNVHLLAVRRERHRRGVGRALVAVALDAAGDEGARFLTVRTLGPSDPSAAYAGTRAAYLALGFAPLAELVGVWPDGRPMMLLCRTVQERLGEPP